MGRNNFGVHNQITRKVPISSWQNNKLYYTVTHINSKNLIMDIPTDGLQTYCHQTPSVELRFNNCQIENLAIVCPHAYLNLHMLDSIIQTGLTISPSSTIDTLYVENSTVVFGKVYDGTFHIKGEWNVIRSDVSITPTSPVEIRVIYADRARVINRENHQQRMFSSERDCPAIFTSNVRIVDNQNLGCSMIDGIGEMPPNPLEGFSYMPPIERDELGFIVYKQFGPFYPSPKHWIIEPGSIIKNAVDTDRANICSYGINVSPDINVLLAITGKYHIPIWKCRIRYEWLHLVIWPYEPMFGHRVNKFRVGQLELLETVSLPTE